MQDDLLKGKTMMKTSPSTQSDKSRRYHMYGTMSLPLDNWDDQLKVDDSMENNEEKKHEMTQDSPMSLQLYPS
jgi:hypothetical protein